MADQSKIKAPSLSMPSGGGAIRGIGEPFKAESFTGGAGFSLPLPLPDARGTTPAVSLSYQSGNGNGPVGLGMALSIPSVALKTSNGVPKYDGTDVYILAGAGELVPALVADGKGGLTPEVKSRASDEGITWSIAAYVPRIQGSWDRIEQWTDMATQESHWRVITAGNETELYGLGAESRIADPDAPLHVYEWLLAATCDAHGNRVAYTYRPEDGVGIPSSPANAGRDRSAQRYLWEVRYGNYAAAQTSDIAPPVPGGDECYAFTLCLDYGQIDWQDPDAAFTDWDCRPDPFSSYKTGFELRTWRRCRGFFMRHHFLGENGGQPFVTQATLLSFGLTAHSCMSIVERVWQRGYQRDAQGNLSQQDTPALSLHFQPFAPEAQLWKPLDCQAPNYLLPNAFTSVDIYGDGIDGLLWSDESYTGYQRPKGLGHFGPMEPLTQFPLNKDLGNGMLSFNSLSGNGDLELVVTDGAASGYYALEDEGEWQSFKSFASIPSDLDNPAAQHVDVAGSGMAALVVMDDRQFKAYPSLGPLGYAPPQFHRLPPLFPSTESASDTELLTFADPFGDGLQHRLRIENGRVTAWPCLGHGKYGSAVNFDNAPVIDGGMLAANIRLIDTDGSGALDIIYLQQDRMRLWVNQNGNGFAPPIDIPLPSPYDQLTQVTAGDFTGYGTASLLYTQAAPVVTHLYYDFAGGAKPYLLRESENGVGGRSVLDYTTSVLEYMRDREEGRIWPTRLPFPVHVTQKVTVHDDVVGSRFTQRFRYHDGYFDPVEREFRGFGFVESWDTEEYAEFLASATLPQQAAELIDKNLYVPPTYSRAWFLTGAYEETPEILEAYRKEAFQGDELAWSIPEFVLGDGLTNADAETLRQAYAALAGHNIRSELYAEDGSAQAQNPYSVSTDCAELRLVQPRAGQRYCSLMVLDAQSLSYNYERNPADPMISQSLVLETNAYGQTTLSASVAYPRRVMGDKPNYPEQEALHCVVAQADYINTGSDSTAAPNEFWQILGVNWQGKSFEIGGIHAPENGPFTPAGLRTLVEQALAQPIGAENKTRPTTPWSKLLSWERSYYWNAAQDAALDGGEITSRALLHSGASAMMSSELVSSVYGDKVDEDMLQYECGYVLDSGYWWNAGLVQHYHREPEKFYLPLRTDNPRVLEYIAQGQSVASGLDTSTSVHYDRYQLYPIETAAHLSPTEALRSFAAIDYQSLQAWRMIDPNENVSEAIFDPLGKVIATTAYGKLAGVDVGDLPINQYVVQRDATFESVIASPETYLQGATTYFFYNEFAWQDPLDPQPVSAIALQRMEHVHDDAGNGPPDGKTRIQIVTTFSDGTGNVLQAKAHVGPGPLTLRKGDGTLQNPSSETKILTDRWLVTGRVVHDNKGQIVEAYQPYFSAVPTYEDQQAIIDEGLVPPPSITQYDPVGRVVKATTPKGFFSKSEFTAWESKTYDLNDTVLDSAYYQWFQKTYPNPSPGWEQNEATALAAAAKCYNTPSMAIVDNLGRAIRSIQDNLGAVPKDRIPAEVAAPLTPQAAWQSLVDAQYLLPDTQNSDIAWVTDKFQPYWPEFATGFEAQYSAQLLNWLAQSCLTSMVVYDISGNILLSADPRLFAEILRTGEPHFNFETIYDMQGTGLFTRSVDAGDRWALQNMYGNPVRSWDSRNFSHQSTYDRLQRPLQLSITGGDGTEALNNVVAISIYGDAQPDAASLNLRGQLFQHYDDSGLTTAPMYGLGGQPLQSETQFRADYRGAVNWTDAEQERVQSEPVLLTQTAFNALGAPTSQTLPDGSIIRNGYSIGGRLMRVTQQLADANGQLGEEQEVEQILGFDANGNVTEVRYGNGVQSKLTYDAMTQELMQVRTTRTVAGGGVAELRTLAYTYDPMGHEVICENLSLPTEFYGNQAIAPTNHYAFDPLYRLVSATGKTLPGINMTGARNSDVTALIGHRYAPKSDLKNLENYTRRFAYDAGGNLVVQHHIAASGNWTQTNVITQGSNRLLTQVFGNPKDTGQRPPSLPYDGNGNLLRLYPDSKAVVGWNYSNNIAQVTQIARSATDKNGQLITLNDAEYYVYNGGGGRTRKVTERMQQGGTSMVVTDKLYLGSYEVTRVYTRATPLSTNAAADSSSPISEKRTIHAGSDGATLATTDVWVLAPKSTSGPQSGDMQTRFMLHDTLGSVTMMLTTAAEVMSYEEYYPYGGTAYTIAENQVEADSKEYRFCGKECDSATGLYYYGARYYATWQCRWMSPDPAGTVDGPNLYAYVGGNPVGYNDPSGMGKKNKNAPRTFKGSDRLHDGTRLRDLAPKRKNRNDPYHLQDLLARSKALTSEIRAQEYEVKRNHIGRVREALNDVDGYTTAYDSILGSERARIGNQYKEDTIRVHWKGIRENGVTSGIPLKVTKSKRKDWDAAMEDVNRLLSERLLELDGFSGTAAHDMAAEISHALAASHFGPSDSLSAHPSSVHQNTEWMAIESGIGNLSKQFAYGRVRSKITNYVHDGSVQGTMAGTLKAARYKIYIDGKKVFDHLSLGDRGNFGSQEAQLLKNSVLNLDEDSPEFKGNIFKPIKGVHNNLPDPKLVTKHHLDSTKTPLFTDIRVGSTRMTGVAAKAHMDQLYPMRNSS